MIEIMTDKNTVLEAIRKLPDDVSLWQIVDKIEILAVLQNAHEDSVEGRTKTHAEVGAMIQE